MISTFCCLPDPPWAPGKPTVKDVAKTSAFLMWTKPEHDGGAKIESYIIEMLKSGTVDWIRVAEDINILEHFLKSLMEKQEYSFRVKAVNAAGESEPSEPSDPVLCKERLSKSPTFTVCRFGSLSNAGSRTPLMIFILDQFILSSVVPMPVLVDLT